MKGFTLMEVLVVIVVLAIVFAISVPVVTNYLETATEKTYQRQIESIESAAEGWAAKNLKVLPENDGDFITIYLGELKNSGLIKENLKNPMSGETFFDDVEIIITKTSGGYEFEVKPETGTGTTDFSTLNPIIVLIGLSTEETEINVPYIEKGITATDRFGKAIRDYEVVYKSNGVEVDEIDTSRLGVYTVHYTVAGIEGGSEATRTVQVVDNVAPELSIPGDISMLTTSVAAFDAMAGVVASDNSGENVNVQVTGNLSAIPGTYVLTYTATDTSNNQTIRTRTITVQPLYADASGASAPQLYDAMIPVKWDGSKWVKADLGLKWYDYTAKEWANAVLVYEENRATYLSAPSGTAVLDADIVAFYVWIPRYKYKLFNVNSISMAPQTIEIQFESAATTKSTGSTNGTWLTHPAFTLGTSEKEGFWMGKYETGQSDLGKSIPTIKPNKYSYYGGNIASQFSFASSMLGTSTGLIFEMSSGVSRIIKNTEWGAVTYLTYSSYGANTQIWRNSYSSRMTGCSGASADPATPSGTCIQYNTSNGVKASTTWNVYGVYDMSGGVSETVMGLMRNSANTDYLFSDSGLNWFYLSIHGYSNGGIDAYPYRNGYSYTSIYSDRILGDATGEVNGWYTQSKSFIYYDTGSSSHQGTWFSRGGEYESQGWGSPTSFFYDCGELGTYDGTRYVLNGF